MPRGADGRAAAWAALFGLGVGALDATPQVAVEPAQVLARLVAYPPDNPFFVYQAKLWTLLHQAAAVLLLARVGEAGVSIVLSAAIPAALFAGVALWVRAASSSAEAGEALGPGTAALLPFAALLITGVGVNYPVLIAGTEHTYGAAGLAASFLGTGLVAVGSWRAGGLVLGLAPAVHASLGSWTLLSMLLAWPWGDPDRRADRRAFVRGLATGAALTAASLAAHFALRPDFQTTASGAEAQAYFETFVRLWDVHRGPLVASHTCVMLAVVVIAAAVQRLGADASAGGRVLLRFVIAAGVVGLLAGALAHGPWPVPRALLMLMPNRFLNVLVLGAVPLTAAWMFRSGTVGHVAFLAFVVALARAPLDLATDVPRLLAAGVALGATLGVRDARAARRVTVGAACLIGSVMLVRALGYHVDREIWRWLLCAPLFVAIAWARAASREKGAAGAPLPAGRRPPWLMLLPAAFVAAVVLGTAAYQMPGRYERLDAARTNGALQALAAQPAMTAVGSDLFLIQWGSRAPVLLDPGALDAFAYAAESGPAFVRLWRLLYEADFFTSDGRSPLDGGRVQEVWEGRTAERWGQLSGELGFRYVLVHSGWTLRLPERARSGGLVLYDVPASDILAGP